MIRQTGGAAVRGRLPQWVISVLVPAGIVFLGLVAWAPSIQRSGEFWFDDYDLLASTYMGLHDFSPAQLLPWTPAHRPLGRNLFALMVFVFGENPTAFHWVQLSLHCVNAVLLWFLILVLTREWLAALAGSTVFLLSLSAYHPVTWSSTVFDVASATLILAAMLMVAHAFEQRCVRRPWLLFGALPVYLLALKTKDAMLVFPALALVYFLLHGSCGLLLRLYAQRLFGRRSAVTRRSCGSPKAEIIFLAVASVVTLSFYWTANIHTRYSAQAIDPYYVVWSVPVSLKSFGFYLGTLFYQEREFGLALTALLLLLPVCLAVALREKNLLFGSVWYGLFLLPVSLLINHYRFLHYPYLAVAGVAIGVAALLQQVSTRAHIPSKIRGVAPVLFLVLFVPTASRQLHAHTFVRWQEQVHRENRQMLAALRSALPAPAADAEILLVIPTLNPFSHSPSSVLQVIYGDLSLSGRLFENAEDARDYLAGAAADRPRSMVTWEDGAFLLSPAAGPRRDPPQARP